MKPYEVLGLPADASEQEIRAAYLNKVKEFPPEQSPETFEAVRDAYESLRDPRKRAEAMLLSTAFMAPLVSLIDNRPAQRKFARPTTLAGGSEDQMTVGIERDQILRRFETLLDSALTGEEAPGGIDAEILSSVMTDEGEDKSQRSDSYALWAAITALTQEIKLQGRAFQELNHTLTAQTGKASEELRAVYNERERTLQRDAERRSRRDVLRPLIDLRDRLGRGLQSVRASQRQMANTPPAGWWARVFGKQAADPSTGVVEALVRGYELAVQRLDQALDEFNVREISCRGEIFDSRTMNAIESEESAAVAPGTVLEVYLSGYEWSGEVFRPAQVKVSREPAIHKEKE